jgi:tetratricopeptide (TPR) repeat protein
VVGKLSPQQRERLAGSRPISPEATELLFKGVFACGRQSYQSYSEAINYFEQAIRKQPDFALAYSKMSFYYLQFLWVGPLAPREFMPKAEEAARTALRLDEGLAEAHAVLGTILYQYHWNWSAAETEFRRAVDVNPNSADSHRMFAFFLRAAGRSQEASAQGQRARELDPLPVQRLGILARADGKYDQAVKEGRDVLEKDPQRPRAHFQLGVTYVEKGDFNEGIAELETAVKLSQDLEGPKAPGNPRFIAYLGYANAAFGKRGEAQEILDKLESLSRQQYVTPVGIATIHMGLGEKEKALASLEEAYQAHDGDLIGIPRDHRWDTLHSDPHFQDLLRRVGLAR